MRWTFLPAANGCYWDAGLAALESGRSTGWLTWSSSMRSEDASRVFMVQFGNAAVAGDLKSDNRGLARCVRGGP